MEKIIIKKINDTVYKLLHCPYDIESTIWGNCVNIGEMKRVDAFHSSWIGKINEVCKNNGVELIIE
jgi:hypothetical protein